MFRTEPGHPELLHIYTRHLTGPQDAMDTFFHPEAASAWNAERARWETRSATHTLYWYWIEEGRTVMVISCFRN